jgi:hypothetical protein
MNAGVRLIKRADVILNSPCGNEEKTGRQNERKIGATVKNWIAELAQRKRADEQSAAQMFLAIH